MLVERASVPCCDGATKAKDARTQAESLLLFSAEDVVHSCEVFRDDVFVIFSLAHRCLFSLVS